MLVRNRIGGTAHELKVRKPVHCGRRRRRVWALAAVAVLSSLGLSGCSGFPDRRAEANEIERAILAMPGVAEVDVSYDTNFTNGAHFYTTVTLDETITNEQGGAVGREFVERMVAAEFRRFDVELELEYRRPRAGAGKSHLEVDYYFDDDVHVGMSAEEVAQGAMWWLDVARSPAVSAVSVSLPLDTIYAEVSPPLRVTLPVDADDALLTELIARHPQLNSAQWGVELPAAGKYRPPRSYTSRGRFLDSGSRRIWQRIVEQIGPDDQAEASTKIPPKPGQPPTTVEIGWGVELGREPDLDRVARDVPPLLTELPGPVRFHLNTRFHDGADVVDRDVVVTVGGCTPPHPEYNNPDVPLEADLRARYESC